MIISQIFTEPETEVKLYDKQNGVSRWQRAQWQNVGLSAWPVNFPGPALDLQLTGNHLVDKPSAIGQPTQPFVLFGLINEQ